jgi:hypothetical protein
VLMDAKKLLESTVSTHSAKMSDAVWEAFKEALPDEILIGRAVSVLMTRYLSADPFERVVMLNPDISIREILRQMIKEEFREEIRNEIKAAKLGKIADGELGKTKKQKAKP